MSMPEASSSSLKSLRCSLADLGMHIAWDDLSSISEEDNNAHEHHEGKRHLWNKFINGDISVVHALLKARKLSTLRVMTGLLKMNPGGVMSKSDENGRKPLSMVAHQGYLEGVSYLLTNFPKYADEPDEDGMYPIHSAAMGGHDQVVAEFLGKCAHTIDQTNSKNQTILHVAALHSRISVLVFLLEAHRTSITKALGYKDNDGATFTDYLKRNAKESREACK